MFSLGNLLPSWNILVITTSKLGVRIFAMYLMPRGYALVPDHSRMDHIFVLTSTGQALSGGRDL
jgi:hypothetical protein